MSFFTGDNAATMAAWATVLATVIGPILGVWLAYIFSKRQSKSQAASELFSRIVQHSQELSFTTSRYHVAIALNPKVQGLVTKASTGNDGNSKNSIGH